MFNKFILNNETFKKYCSNIFSEKTLIFAPS